MDCIFCCSSLTELSSLYCLGDQVIPRTLEQYESCVRFREAGLKLKLSKCMLFARGKWPSLATLYQTRMITPILPNRSPQQWTLTIKAEVYGGGGLQLQNDNCFDITSSGWYYLATKSRHDISLNLLILSLYIPKLIAVICSWFAYP